MDEMIRVPKRILSTLLTSIAAGVVPRAGAPYIAIGRSEEIAALLSDLDCVAEGAATMRFIIGKYGSGKSFLLQLIRGSALDRGFVCADADLSPERRICGAKGTGIATYRELLRNLSSKASPDGGALNQIIARWLSTLQADIAARGALPGSEAFCSALTREIFSVTRDMEGEIGGFDFAAVLGAYYRAYNADDEEKKSACMRWLRGEYTTKTEARAALGVGSIIDDDNWYDYIKLWAVFFRRIGYRGFVVMIDECVNLYKITNRISRENNYEKILSMFNDTLQGKAEGLALLLGGTPQFLEDTRRGLFSYEALRSRLAEGQFNGVGAGNITAYKNMIGPVIRLRRLSDDEMLALIARIARLHGQNYGWDVRVTTEDMTAFLRLCLARAGADAMITPREIIRDFCTVLNILLQNPDASFADVVGQGVVTLRHAPGAGEEEASSEADPEPAGQDKPAQNAAANPAVPYKADDFDFDLADIDI
ncbi:MAG: ATP-binding protein [Clostridia bacterium]|nr:ATP-binding protein [Clostridia bacterium]